MQSWHARNRDTWTPSALGRLANDTEAGGYRVRLNSYSSPNFTHHKDGVGVTTPLHTTTITSLRDALPRLWPADSGDGGESGDGGQSGSVGESDGGGVSNGGSGDSGSGRDGPKQQQRYHYLSSDVEDLPVEVASPVMQFVPQGCMHDTRWAAHVLRAGGAVFSQEEIDDAHEELREEQHGEAACRGLKANLWLGNTGVSTAAHYDREHNLFFQASGSKRFVLLPPAAHRELRLHPRWHGSRRQSRADLPALLGPGGGESGEGGSDGDGMSDAQLARRHPPWVATLEAGDVLYLPPLWFHHVTSLAPNVALNLWQDSTAERVWRFVTNGGAAGAGEVRAADDRDGVVAGRWSELLHGSCLRLRPSDHEQSEVEVGAAAVAGAEAGPSAEAEAGESARLSRLFACTCRLASSLLDHVASGSLGSGDDGSAAATAGPPAGARLLAERAAALVATRYSPEGGGDAPAQAPSRPTPAEQARRRATVAKACDRMRSAAGEAEGGAALDAVQRQQLRAYADALRAVDDVVGTRDLILDDLVETFAEWAVGDAAAGLAQVQLGACAVRTFLEKCLIVN